MEKPLKIKAWVTTGNSQYGARILRENPAARSWAGELVEITVSSANRNARHEMTVEATSCRGEMRTFRIAVFTTLSVEDREHLYAAAINRRSDITSALKEKMARADRAKRENEIAPPA